MAAGARAIPRTMRARCLHGPMQPPMRKQVRRSLSGKVRAYYYQILVYTWHFSAGKKRAGPMLDPPRCCKRFVDWFGYVSDDTAAITALMYPRANAKPCE